MKKILHALFIYGLCTSGWAATITFDPATPLQRIDGFGASTAALNFAISSAQNDLFYTTIGLSIDRIEIYPSQAACEGWVGAGNCVVTSGATLTVWDLTNAKAAVARGATIWATEWSPPASMKAGGDFNTGSAFIGGVSNYTALATIQASFVTLLTGTYGIAIDSISPQNEPDVSISYPSCTWTGTQFHDYVPHLRTALNSAGFSTTKIMVAEPGTWTNGIAANVMNDAAVAPQVGILASHAYSSSASLLSYSNVTTQHQWQTEVSDFNAYDGTITSGLTYATQINNWLTTAQVNAWLYWGMSAQGLWTDNEGLTDFSGVVAKRAYTIGNFAKFVKRGWNLVTVTNSTGLLVTAFIPPQPSTELAAVVVNNGSAVTGQVFCSTGTISSAVQVFLTSSTANLQAQANLVASSNCFTYTVPASSVTTFVYGVPPPGNYLLIGRK